MAALEEAFHLASSKFKISELNAYQKLSIRKIVIGKENIFVNLPVGFGKSLIYLWGERRCVTAQKNGCGGDC